jgi:hypothetical protein
MSGNETIFEKYLKHATVLTRHDDPIVQDYAMLVVKNARDLQDSTLTLDEFVATTIPNASVEHIIEVQHLMYMRDQFIKYFN